MSRFRILNHHTVYKVYNMLNSLVDLCVIILKEVDFEKIPYRVFLYMYEFHDDLTVSYFNNIVMG